MKLLAYHSFALGKYQALGRAYPHEHWNAPVPPNLLDWARKKAHDLGLAVAS